jgi:prophage antirepressor-like protein
MSQDIKDLAIFEGFAIRRIWAEEQWWFAVADVIAALTGSTNPGQYWRTLKSRMLAEGANETVANCNTFKMPAADGKMRNTDCANTENILRIIQSIPSPRAEPFKQWLAQVGAEVIEEREDLDALYQDWRQHAIESYTSRGYSHDWAEQRVDSITVRNALTKEWSVRGIKDREFSILTDRLHMESFGLTVQAHMGIKNFPVTRQGRHIVYRGNLRDGMTLMELAIVIFGENIVRALHITHDSQGFQEIADDVTQAGAITYEHRELLEQQLGQPIVSSVNAIPATNTLWGDLLPPTDA